MYSRLVALLTNRDFYVCSAWVLSNGFNSRVSPYSGNCIAKGKDVHHGVK